MFWCSSKYLYQLTNILGLFGNLVSLNYFMKWLGASAQSISRSNAESVWSHWNRWSKVLRADDKIYDICELIYIICIWAGNIRNFRCYLFGTRLFFLKARNVNLAFINWKLCDVYDVRARSGSSVKIMADTHAAFAYKNMDCTRNLHNIERYDII